MSQTTTQSQPRTMILINGKSIQALTPERVDEMIKGMSSKGKLMTGADHGRYIQGIKVLGDGTPYEGPLGLRYIYNVDLLSEIAFSGPKAEAALQELYDMQDDGNATVEEIHNACRAFMNSVTVSFNANSRSFHSGELIKANIELVTTENGSLITLRNAVAQPAENLKASVPTSFSLSKLLGDRKAAELKTAESTESGTVVPANPLANPVTQ